MRSKAVITGIAVLVILAVWAAGVPVLAEQTLTIALDSSQSKNETDVRSDHATPGATRDSASGRYRVEIQTKGEPNAKEVVIGLVGVVRTSKANIRTAPSRKAQVLYRCAKDTHVAVLGENKGWYGLLMADSSTGWIQKRDVSLLSYKVVGQQPRSSGPRDQIVDTALKYRGIRYKWGGYSFDGLDCSGFVKAVFASHGVNLPRASRDQAAVGMPVGWAQLQPGDRLYFACKGGQIDHAGIYLGNGLFIHSSRSRGCVGVDSVLTPFYANSLVAARR